MTLPFRKCSNDPNFVGYPLYYIVEGECVCKHCCNEAWEIAEAVNWENKHLYCSDCGVRIETAYKEDEIEEENDFIYEFYHEHGRNPEEDEVYEALGRYTSN